MVPFGVGVLVVGNEEAVLISPFTECTIVVHQWDALGIGKPTYNAINCHFVFVSRHQVVGLGQGRRVQERELSRKRDRLSKSRSVRLDLDLTAAGAAIPVHQSAKFHIENGLFVDLPFVVAMPAQGVSAVTFTRLARFEG